MLPLSVALQFTYIPSEIDGGPCTADLSKKDSGTSPSSSIPEPTVDLRYTCSSQFLFPTQVGAYKIGTKFGNSEVVGPQIPVFASSGLIGLVHHNLHPAIRSHELSFKLSY